MLGAAVHRATPAAPRRPAAARKGIFACLSRGWRPGLRIFRPCGPRGSVPPIRTARIEPATKSRNSPGDEDYKNSSSGRPKNSARPLAWSLLMARLPAGPVPAWFVSGERGKKLGGLAIMGSRRANNHSGHGTRISDTRLFANTAARSRGFRPRSAWRSRGRPSRSRSHPGRGSQSRARASTSSGVWQRARLTPTGWWTVQRRHLIKQSDRGIAPNCANSVEC